MSIKIEVFFFPFKEKTKKRRKKKTFVDLKGRKFQFQKIERIT